jgi:hypothetical protein
VIPISGVLPSSMGEFGPAHTREVAELAYLLSQITGVFKTMIDHIPLSIGSVRPTQGKILAVSQVSIMNSLTVCSNTDVVFPGQRW